jgi:biotin carboxyl carrier protein
VSTGFDRVVIPHADRIFIDGEWAPPSTGARIEVVNPANEQTLFHISEAAEADMAAAARRAFDHGPCPNFSPSERATYLRRMADGLCEYHDTLANLWTDQIGVLAGTASRVTGNAPRIFEYYADLAETFPFVERRTPSATRSPPGPAGDGTDTNGASGQGGRQAVVVEVNGKRLEVTLPAGLGFGSTAPATTQPPAPRGSGTRRQRVRGPAAAASGTGLAAPMQGTVVKVAVSEGLQVEAGDLIIVLEAMKLEQPVNAHKTGTVTSLSVHAGDSVTSGAVICEITDLTATQQQRRTE